MSVELIKSPWIKELHSLAQDAEERALVVAPYVTAEGWHEFLSNLNDIKNMELYICTSISADAVSGGFLDLRSLAETCQSIGQFSLRHVPRLHAKVYIADNKKAIVTSGNLTMASLMRNVEYGVQITEKKAVDGIERDIRDYASLGALVACDELEKLASMGEKLDSGGVPISTQANRDFDLRVLELRGNSGDSRTTVLARTIYYLLGKAPMRTSELHPLIQDIHPDLCNDDEHRLINGISFGRRWKHDVRNAQLTLKRQGRITQDPEKRWHIV